ncbi:sensor histidine kinase [Sediminispirochaeta bajacaliforniensis]|uniref:sensor histidine kinase n=1 Tax=Sediminispirochaeta bajacaliforniensis TaxID=148 RepID=UPI0003706995|nr:ATP-binding protein [Sediminispirochaeta bajacaliforniensis]
MNLIHSFRGKLYLTILFSALLMMFSILLFFGVQYRFQAKADNASALVSFYRRNIADMGARPNKEMGMALSKRLGIDIIFFADDGYQWESTADQEVIRFAEITMHNRKGDNRGLFKGKLYVGLKDTRGYFFFYGNLLFNLERLRIFLGILLIVGLFSYLIVFLLLRIFLFPLKELEQGVGALKSGDLSYRIRVIGEDEIGELSAAFNHMADQIQKMLSDKEQLLLDVSHELKTPIARMKVGLEFLKDEELRNSFRDDLDELDIKVKELLNTARLDTPYGTPQKKRVDIVNFLETIVAGFPKESPGILFRPGDQPPLFAAIDPDLFQTACTNILENALRYSSSASSPVEVSCRKRREEIIIEFLDHGPGIPENDIDRVFEPFYRVDSSRDKRTGGFGLGLYLVRKIVIAHDGFVELESGVGKGTLVRIRISQISR